MKRTRLSAFLETYFDCSPDLSVRTADLPLDAARFNESESAMWAKRLAMSDQRSNFSRLGALAVLVMAAGLLMTLASS